MTSNAPAFPVEGIYFQGETLRVESLPHGVKRLVLSRPELRNAFNEKMMAELSEAFTRLAATRIAAELRLLVLAGDGPVFCAGADLSYMKKQAESGEPASLRDARALGQMFFRLAQMPVPVIAAVKGAAIGGGFGLAVCSDYVLAEESALLATTEVRLGIVPGVISPYIVRKLGVAFAQTFMLSGERRTASSHECRASGLVSRTVGTDEDFDAALESTLVSFLQAGPDAARRTKELLRRISPLPAPDIFELTAANIAQARCSEEGRAGLTAFFDRKAPPWQNGLAKPSLADAAPSTAPERKELS